MNYNLKKIPKRMIMGLVYEGEHDLQAMGSLWESFYQRLGEIKNINDEKTFYGISEPFVEGEDFVYLAGVEVETIEELPQDMQVWYLSHEDYIEVELDLSEKKSASQGFSEIYDELLGELGLYPTDDYDYEVYNEAFYDEEPGRVFLHVPIKRDAR